MKKRVKFAKERNAFVLDHHHDRHGRRHVQTINFQVFPFDIKLSHDSEVFLSYFCIWFGFLYTFSSGNCEKLYS